MNWKPNLKNARRKETIMKLYNTLTRKKEEFVPLEEGKVKCMFVVLQFMTTFTLVMQDLTLSSILSEDIWNIRAMK